MTALLESGRSALAKILHYIERNFGCLLRDPRLFLMRKIARFELIRNLARNNSKDTTSRAKSSDKSPDPGNSLFDSLEHCRINTTLEQDGYYIGINLPREITDELTEFAHNTNCFGDRNPDWSFSVDDKDWAEKSCQRKFLLGSYMGKVSTCPAFQKIANDPGLLSIASNYLGGKPICVEYELCWSFPAPASQYEQLKAAQVFHYDIDDYNSIKFFFYLTDVDESSGPHVFLRGTHKHKKLSHQVLGERCTAIESRKLVDYYGEQNTVTILGPKGTGFVGDTFCFHKGTLPTERNRLLLQLEFTLNKYNGLRNC